MIVGVNTRLLIHGKLEGIGYFQEQLLMRMCKMHPHIKFVFFFDRQYSKEFIFSDNIIPIVIPLPTRHPLLWKVYFDYLLPLYCKKYKIDVFFSPENYIPKLKGIPTICTIHDLNFYHNNQYIGSSSHQRYFMRYFPLNAHRCDKIITVSEYSKQDIINSWSIDESKIEVVYNAANKVYYPRDEQTNIATKQKYALGKDYFYFVGAIHKRKNLINIFLAFDIFKDKVKSDIKLLIVGSKKWWRGEIEDTYNLLRHKQDIIFTGRLQANEVALISSASIGLVFPSLFEGFGIPVVEAMACGCCVITSNTTSLPEVAGDSALIVNPYSVDEIALAMQEIYQNNNLRKDLIQKGFQRCKLFNWNTSADKLWNIIKSCKK